MSTSERPAGPHLWNCPSCKCPRGGDAPLAMERAKTFACGPHDCPCWGFYSAAPTPEAKPLQGRSDGLPGRPTTAVGSGSAADGEWVPNPGAYACVFLVNGRHCLKDAAMIRRTPTSTGDGRCEAHREDVGALIRATAEAYDKTTKRLLDMVAPAKPQPQRATYASLMASLRAEEGVPEPARCSGCGRAPCWPPAHVSADAHTAARMREVYEDPRPPEPDHWRPSVDPLFDIPEWNEFGSRKP